MNSRRVPESRSLTTTPSSASLSLPFSPKTFFSIGRDFARWQFGQIQFEIHCFAVPQHFDRRRCRGRSLRNHQPKMAIIAHFFPLNSVMMSPIFTPASRAGDGPLGSRPRARRYRSPEVKLLRQVRVHTLNFDASMRAKLCRMNEAFHDAARHINGDGKTDTDVPPLRLKMAVLMPINRPAHRSGRRRKLPMLMAASV